MGYNQSTNVSGLLFDYCEINNVEAAKNFSDFCEATCNNLFAFSPYELHIDREEFFLFQVLADELKIGITSPAYIEEKMTKACSKLFFLYENLMRCCWEAFIENPDIKSDAGIFVVNQMQAVNKYEKKAIPFTKN